jgi:hypothetical protein
MPTGWKFPQYANQIDDGVGARDALGHRPQVLHIAQDHLAAIQRQALPAFGFPHQEARHMPGREQRRDDMGADKSGATDQADFHVLYSPVC